MIRKFDFRKQEATIQGLDGSIWTCPLRLAPVLVNGQRHLFDFGKLLQDHAVSLISTVDDVKAVRDLIASWPDFEEKEMLLGILDKYISETSLRNCQIRFEAMLEAYGTRNGLILKHYLDNGKLASHKDVMTKKTVVDLVQFLLQKTPYLACNTFPSPNSAVASERVVQQSRFKSLLNEIKPLVRGVESFHIFTAWRIASLLEKRTQPRPRPPNASTNRPFRSMLVYA